MVIGPFDRDTWLLLLCLKHDIKARQHTNSNPEYIKRDKRIFKELVNAA